MNLDTSNRQAHESPEFRNLVSREIQSETRDEILTLKNSVTTLQYRDYLARPENQDLIQRVRESGFKYLSPRSKILYRELLIVCKLWLIQDSTVNFIKVEDTLDDAISLADNSLLDRQNNLRSGLLPLFDRFYLSDQNAVFRSQNGRNMNFLKSGKNVSQVFIDFNQVPILENIEGLNADGETVQMPHLRINMFLDDEGNEYPANNIFVPVNKLQTQSRVEDFQSEISYMFAPKHTLLKVRNKIQSKTLDGSELTRVIKELPLYSKFYQASGDRICKQIIDYVLEQKPNYILFFSLNLRFIRQLIGSNKTIQMATSIISKLDEVPNMDIYFWRNILEFRYILGNEFTPVFTSFIDKIFENQRSRSRSRRSRHENYLSFLFKHSRELFGDQSEIYLADVISKLQERGINLLTISNFHYLSNDIVIQAIRDLPEEQIYILIHNLDAVCLALEIPKSQLIPRLRGILRESTFERFILSLSDHDIDLDLVSGHLGLIVKYKPHVLQLGPLLVKSHDFNFNITILNELNSILDRSQIAEFCSIVISNLNFYVVLNNLDTFSRFYEAIDSLNSIPHRLAFIDCYPILKDPAFNDSTNLDKVIFLSSLLRKYRESNYIHMVEDINDSHEFSSLDSKSLDDLYLMLIIGGPHMYTSTFNGVFDKFLEVFKSEQREVLEYLDSRSFTGFRSFIGMCVTFHRFDDLSKLMTDKSMSQLLTKIFNQLDFSGNNYFNNFISAAEILALLPEQYINSVSSLLLQNYRRLGNGFFQIKFKSLYGLLISIVVNRYNISSGDLFEISRNYPIKSTTFLRSSEMFTEHPENPNLELNVQVHLFYDDKDARASFNSFMSNYPNPKEENDHFVIIEQRQGTRVVRMYVSKPANDDIGVTTNYNALKQSLGRLPVHMLVHRGHSYHVNDSLPRINENTRLVLLGSCGGYRRVPEVYYRSKGAQIISTSGTGTMSINNPLIRDINQSLLSQDRINWPEFWSRHGRRYSSGKAAQRWPYYIGPHRNIALNFLNAYHSLK